MVFFISSIVLGFLDQLRILGQLYLIELLGLVTGLRLLEPWHLICATLWNTLWSNDLVVKALDSQSGSPVFKTTGWLQG